MPSVKKPTLQRYLFVLFLILPYLVFYLIFPFISKCTLGNDYGIYPIQNQLYLMFSLQLGSFPLFIPGFFIGHSAAALTLGQMFHPLPHLAAALPLYWQGQALEWNTALRLLSLGLTHWFLFTFLSRLNLRTALAFLVSFVTVYNLRMLDTFRFGAALEAYTAHLLLIAAIGRYWLIRPRSLREPLFIIAFAYLLVVSGHPQMMYYGFLSAGLFLFVIPFFSRTVLPGKSAAPREILLFWGKTAAFMAGGVGLASAYILPLYYDFILINSTRVARDYAWANVYLDTWTGAWGNFMSPLLSGIHGAFGASSLITLVLVLPVLCLRRIRIPGIIWTLWVLFIAIFLGSLGGKTPLYSLFWKYAPLASSFRVPGRLALILPMLIMLLLSWILSVPQSAGKEGRVPPLRVLALAAVIITICFNGIVYPQLTAPETNSEILSTQSFFTLGLRDPFLSKSNIHLVFLLSLGLGLGLLGLLMFTDLRASSSRIILLLCLIAILQVSTVLRHGTFYRAKQPVPTFGQISRQNYLKLGYPFYPGYGLASSGVSEHLDKFFGEPFLAKIYKKIIPVPSREKAYAGMAAELTPQIAYVETADKGMNMALFRQDPEEPGGRVHLDYSAFNQLKLTVLTPSPALLGLAYPYSDYWKVLINGQKAETYRINGLYLGLALPQGQSRISMRYFSPPAYWGMVLSCAALFVIGAWAAGCACNGIPRMLAFFFAAMISFGAFKAWHASLYAGHTVGTHYQWNYSPPGQKNNRAYGRPVTVETPFLEYHTGMNAVDGDTYPNSGFISSYQEEPTLQLDLRHRTPVKKIVLFETGNRPEDIPNASWFGLAADQLAEQLNIRPLMIDVSEDGCTWENIATVTGAKQPGQPTVLTFERAHPARYIRIKAQPGGLGLDELEVY